MQFLLAPHNFKKRSQSSVSRCVRRRQSHSGRRFQRLRFELLEDRRLLAGIVKVNPGNLEGWTTSSSGTATVTFEAGPAVPPLGEGSVELAVGANGNSAAQVRNFEYAGTKLSDLTTLHYWTYVDNDSTNPSAGPDQAPFIILNIDLDGSFATTSDRTLLFFEPEYQFGYTPTVPPQGPIVMDVWQQWNAHLGGWWSTTNVAGAGPGANVKPLSVIIAAHPNAMIINQSGLTGAGGVRIVAGFGAGAWDNFVGNADAFSIGVLGDTTTYDFDPGPIITSITDTPDPSEEGEQVTVTATFTDAAPNVVYTATIDWGDGTGPQPGMFNPLTGEVTGTHIYQDDNPSGTSSDQYTITVTVTDPLGNTGVGAELHTVLNVDPEVQTLTGPLAPQPVGTPVTVTATFTDQGTQDTHTAVIDWGDGDTTAGVVTEAGGSGQATGTHTYTEPGVYTVTVTIMDDDLGEDSMSSDEAVPIPFFVVIFDAQGGFVTGGGWYDNPVTATPPLPGKAHFGVNAKFHTGEVVPRGQLHLNFKPGDIKFRSTSYSFMEVTGNTAHLRGEGTNNGAGEFFFRMDVTDNGEPGDNDTFKIKIYQKVDPIGAIETFVLYENPLPTELGGGNIKIHMDSNGLHVNGGDVDAWGGYTLTAEALDSAVAQAIAWWSGEGIDPAAIANLAETQVQIVDLPDSLVGIAGNAAIGIDVNAAGIGWAINGASRGLDLATVVTHELGHLLGFDHDNTHPVMSTTVVSSLRFDAESGSDSAGSASLQDIIPGSVATARATAGNAIDAGFSAWVPAGMDPHIATRIPAAAAPLAGALMTSVAAVPLLARNEEVLTAAGLHMRNGGAPATLAPLLWEEEVVGDEPSARRAVLAETVVGRRDADPGRRGEGRDASYERREGWFLPVMPDDPVAFLTRNEWREACDACFAESDSASEYVDSRDGLLAAGSNAAVALAYLATVLNGDARTTLPRNQLTARRRLAGSARESK